MGAERLRKVIEMIFMRETHQETCLWNYNFKLPQFIMRIAQLICIDKAQHVVFRMPSNIELTEK